MGWLIQPKEGIMVKTKLKTIKIRKREELKR